MPSANHSSERPSVPDLAARLADVIVERGLSPGDRFLTTEEAARHLRVRRELANRALQVLVHRGRIERTQRIGARVCEPNREPPTFGRVHVVVQVNHPRAATWSSSAFQVGLHEALPGCEVGVHVVTTGQVEELLEPLLRSGLRQRRPEGLVLVRCDYPTQRLVADCGLPAVLHGSPYAGVELSSVDVDNQQAGRLQAQSLAAHGCERLVVVRRDRALPGDRAFMNGFRCEAAQHGFGADVIDDLELAPFPAVVAAELQALFAGSPKLGIVCATRELADATVAAADDAGRERGSDLFVYGNHAGFGASAPGFPCLAPVDGDESQGRVAGRLLAERLANPSGAAEHHRIACQLVQPKGRS